MIRAMYMPNEHRGLIKGFVVTKHSDIITISIVDPDLCVTNSVIRDVRTERLSIRFPHSNEKFLRCLAQAKTSISDKEWDAIRKEAVQRYKLADMIPNSKYFHLKI